MRISIRTVSSLRSEQLNEQQSRLSEVQGVPGALSNQPPAAGTAPEVAGGSAAGDKGSPLNSSKRVTRNYELDKTISHTRLPSSTVRRLSVAVVVNDRVIVDEQGAPKEIQRTPEEIDRISNLVKEAIGFNEHGVTVCASSMNHSLSRRHRNHCLSRPFGNSPGSGIWSDRAAVFYWRCC